MAMDKTTRDNAGLKPCSYDPACPRLRSCRPLGLPAVPKRDCRTNWSMTFSPPPPGAFLEAPRPHHLAANPAERTGSEPEAVLSR
jgi:hypothetical protein